MDVGNWLRGLGLERYEQAFRDNDVDAEMLPELTEADLERLGIASLGHRKKLLRGIAALRDGSASPTPVTRPRSVPRGEEPGPAETRQAERRQLTVMFVDLVGSTALSARLDPEDLREVLRAYQNTVAGEITRLGGFVAQYMGDGVLAYFGWPRAHEDVAERAVRAGLALVEVVGRLRAPDGAALACRVGVATGIVVVGDLVGTDEARERAVVGQTPNLAARLQALAEPGSIVIAATTRNLVGELFECRALGLVAAKGFEEPVQAYRVLGPGAVESRFEALHAAPPALVGRGEELNWVLRRWQRARAGEGQVVLIAGEPGVGKSRLLAAAEDGFCAEPHARLRFFCSPHAQDSALRPVISQLEHAAGFASADAPEARLAKLAALLAPTSPRAEDVALLADLLALPTGDDRALLPTDSRLRREWTFAALLRWLEWLGNREPMLVIFEDAHWIDPSSGKLLDLIVERAARLPLLLLVTFRPEFAAPWVGQSHVTALALNRLAPQEALALVRRVASPIELRDDLAATIVERADGVPLFLEELTKVVVEAGAGSAAGTVVVPATLHASLLARIDRLGPAAREVAQLGSVLGREFSHDLLAVVAGSARVDIAVALDQLTKAGLVHRRGTGFEASYLFKHALVRDAAYGTLLRDRRRQLHAGVARVLAEKSGELSRAAPELLAHHLTEAGELEQAVNHWLEAGRRSAERSAEREAVHHLRRGLEVLTALPPSAGRDGLELEFQLALGTPLISLSGWGGPEVATAYERACALCEAQSESGRLAQALFGLAGNRVVRGETRAAERLAERCRNVAERTGSRVDRLQACWATGISLMQLGVLHGARVAFEEIGELYDVKRDRALAASWITDPRASGLTFLSLVLWSMGYPDRARRAANDALQSANELGHANTMCHVHCRAGGELAQLLRDASAARRHAEAVMALAAEHHMAMWRGYANVLRGWTAAEDGHSEEGIALVQEGIADLDALGTRLRRSYHFGLLATIHARRGDLVAALASLERAHEEVSSTEVRFFEAELRRLGGELRVLSGAPESEVEACFAEALAVARQQGARLFELRAATSLARRWRDRGKCVEARNLLTPINGWFTEGHDTPDIRDAASLLETLQ